MEPTNGGEYIVAAYKATPPVTVTALSLGGVGLSQWVLVVTLVYTVLQMGWFIYDKIIRGGRDGRR